MRRFFNKRLTLKERTLDDGRVVIVLPDKCTREEADRFKELWLRKYASESSR